MRVLFCLAVALLATFASPPIAPFAAAAVIHVAADGSGDYPTIQDAIDAAQDGDTVQLGVGTYTDVVTRSLEGATANSVAFLKSGVILESEHGADVTIIDGHFSRHGVVGEFLGASTVVRGITFLNCRSSGQDGNGKWGGGALVIDADPVFENNIFRACTADGGGGFLSRRDYAGTGPTLRGNVFVDNEAGDLGGGLELSYVVGSVVENNTFARNHAYNQGGGGLLVNSAVAVVNRNIFWRNTAPIDAGGVTGINGSGAGVTGSCNLFWENVGGGAPHVANVYIVTGVNGNLVVDPLFCSPGYDNFYLEMDSPGAPDAPGGCGLIGALDVGCGPVSLESLSWGQIKGGYR